MSVGSILEMPLAAISSIGYGYREGQAHEHAELVGCVDALNIKRRILLGITRAPGPLERPPKGNALFRHPRKDVVARAVENAEDVVILLPTSPSRMARITGMPPHTDASKPISQPFFGEPPEELIAPFGKQRLVRGHHPFLLFDCLADVVVRSLGAANQFDYDIHVGCVNQSLASRRPHSICPDTAQRAVDVSDTAHADVHAGFLLYQGAMFLRI